MATTNQHPPVIFRDQEADDAVIGSLLILDMFNEELYPEHGLNVVNIVNEVKSILQPGDFMGEREQRILRAMYALPPDMIDYVTVALKMRETKTIKDGDLVYLQDCADQTPTPRHVVYYAQQVKDWSNRRKQMSEGQRLTTEAFRGKVSQPIKRGASL